MKFKTNLYFFEVICLPRHFVAKGFCKLFTFQIPKSNRDQHEIPPYLLNCHHLNHILITSVEDSRSLFILIFINLPEPTKWQHRKEIDRTRSWSSGPPASPGNTSSSTLPRPSSPKGMDFVGPSPVSCHSRFFGYIWL